MSPERAPAGAFVAVVGPSGAGKDTLMLRAARHLNIGPEVRFARRVVTREAVVASEDHDSLDEVAFARAEAEGAFSLAWTAHGLHYALPRSVGDELARGRTVVANLSRGALAGAADAFGSLWVVEVAARPEVLLLRLVSRGREPEATIRDRLARQVPTALPAGTLGHLRIDNSGDVAAATDLLVRHLAELRQGR